MASTSARKNTARETKGGIHVPRPGRLIQYVKSRVYSPAVGAETAEEIIALYGLTSERPPSNLPLGWRNRNVLVHTSAGKKVLKHYRPKWQALAILHEHSILLRLQELAFPAPRLALTVDGESLVTRNDGYYALFDFAMGVNYASTYLSTQLRRRLQAAAGQTLAQFHRELAGFSPSGRHHLGFRSHTEDRWQDLAWHAERIEYLPDATGVQNGEGGMSDEERSNSEWLAANGPDFQEKLKELDETLSEVPLPRLVIHGDYGIHNLLFHENGTVTVHDFELARLEWRLIDLVITLSRLSYEDWDVFYHAYQAEFPLSADEIHYFPQVWQAYMLQGAVRYWHTYHEIGGEYRLAAACARARRADWALLNQERLFTS